MKSRRIRMKTGDVFLGSFHPSKARYSDEWDGEWHPQKGEECFLMMNIGMSKGPSGILTALFEGVYSYGINTDDIDVSKLKVLAIVEVISVSFTIGEFKKISNQLIPETMPYMAYQIPHIPVDYVVSYSGRNRNMIEYTGNLNKIPKYGVSVTGGYMYWFADYFIKGERNQYLRDDIIDCVCVRPEAAVHKFFPEAKNNPNWVISQLGEEAILQDRDEYDKR